MKSQCYLLQLLKRWEEAIEVALRTESDLWRRLIKASDLFYYKNRKVFSEGMKRSSDLGFSRIILENKPSVAM